MRIAPGARGFKTRPAVGTDSDKLAVEDALADRQHCDIANDRMGEVTDVATLSGQHPDLGSILVDLRAPTVEFDFAMPTRTAPRVVPPRGGDRIMRSCLPHPRDVARGRAHRKKPRWLITTHQYHHAFVRAQVNPSLANFIGPVAISWRPGLSLRIAPPRMIPDEAPD